MRNRIAFIVLLLSFYSSSQVSVDRIRNFSLKQSESEHHSIQPLIRKLKSQQKDSLSRQTFFTADDHARSFMVVPTSDSYFQYDTSVHYRASVGVNFEQSWKKWYNRTGISAGWSMNEDHTQNHGAYRPLNNHQGYLFTDFRTRLTYTPNDQFHLAVGIDNQFFGEGYRSLVQGEQIAPAPFAMIRTNFWNLEYGLMYQFFHENNLPKQRMDWKYNATHYISWNATSNFNIMLFESVMFQGKDSTYKRGFDVEYLNPFLFFRPQEYSLGSSDNILLALQTSYYYLNKKHAVYMQFPLDEFVLKAIMKRSKWWANKYAFQLGFKGQFKRWNYILEGNLVRPYTFSHMTVGENNGTMGRPLGHYLGSNFVEILARIQVPFATVKLGIFGSFVLKGFDDQGVNYGGNIYNNYLNHPKEYGNTIGQGITQRFATLQAQVSTTIRKIQMECYLQAGGQYQWGERASQFIPTVQIGVRNNLFQERKMQ